MARSNSTFAVNETLPTELRDAALIAGKYAITTFKDQFWSDIETLFMALEEKYNEYLKAFDECGGTIERMDDANAFVLTLRGTSVTLVFDQAMYPMAISHTFRIGDDDPPEENDICMIVNAIIAIIYRDTPDKSMAKVKLARQNLVNMEMVNGLEAIAKKLHEDPNSLICAMSGANIQKREADVL